MKGFVLGLVVAAGLVVGYNVYSADINAKGAELKAAGQAQVQATQEAAGAYATCLKACEADCRK